MRCSLHAAHRYAREDHLGYVLPAETLTLLEGYEEEAEAIACAEQQQRLQQLLGSADAGGGSCAAGSHMTSSEIPAHNHDAAGSGAVGLPQGTKGGFGAAGEHRRGALQDSPLLAARPQAFEPNQVRGQSSNILRVVCENVCA